MENTRHRKLLPKNFSKLYSRLLLSYTVVLLIPLVVLIYFYSSRFMKRFYTEIYNTVDSELIQFGTQMDNEWNSMQSITDHLTMTGVTSQAANAAGPLELKPVITALSNYRSANPFLTDIVLVMKDQPYVTTCFTTAEREYYFNQLVTPANTGTSKNVLTDLIDSTRPCCLPSQPLTNRSLNTTTENTLIFSFPVFSDYQKLVGTVMFFVSEHSVQNFKSPRLISYQSQLYIMDQTNSVIMSLGPSPEAIHENKGQYIVRSWHSPENNWSYLAYLPNRQDTFAQVSSITWEFIFSIIIALLLACLVIYTLSRLNYAPIRNLLKKSRQLLPSSSYGPDELDSISYALDYLADQNNELSSKLSGSLNAVRNERLFRLLSGRYDSRQDFNLDCSELDLYLPKGSYCAAIMLLHHTDPNIDRIAKDIQKHSSIPYIYYCIHSLHPEQIIFLVTLTDSQQSPNLCFEDLRMFLAKKYQIASTIGIGTATEQTDCIMQSYMEAASALDYRFVKGNGTVIQFQEITDFSQSSAVYPLEEFTVLKNALFTQNRPAIHTSIQNIILFMEQNPLPLYLARSICFDLVCLVKKQYNTEAFNTSVLELSNMETAQEITDMLKSWSQKLQELPSEKKRSSIAEILAYLDQYVLSPDFSVYEASEHFHMTLPAFSKYFKESTGKNVMDYTIQSRIQKARELLTHTNLPLKDISEQVGYYNVSSFTRRFKLNQGCTPGEYRKSAARSQNSSLS